MKRYFYDKKLRQHKLDQNKPQWIKFGRNESINKVKIRQKIRSKLVQNNSRIWKPKIRKKNKMGQN